MKNKKKHYRNVFKSDHLGVTDLEEMVEDGKRLVFTVAKFTQEFGVKVAGKVINANIAYFDEPIKPLVLNSTNSKQIAKFFNSKWIDDWGKITIELYIDSSVKMKGDIVGGVRIKPNLPQKLKPELTPDHPSWIKAKEAFKLGNATFESIRKNWNLSEENELELSK